jgi:hypothetical protein
MADEIEVEAEEVTSKVPPKTTMDKFAVKASRTKKATPVAKTQVTPVIEDEPIAEVVAETVTVEAETKRARIKGTWRMYFAGQVYDFTDGESHDLPLDLYNYLRGSGNIYDTLA